jgi:hypothetical protein
MLRINTELYCVSQVEISYEQALLETIRNNVSKLELRLYLKGQFNYNPEQGN